ncbi:MAG: response regulator [Spongiibacter sp.]|nr:response regulator [Spongiibacter sp.]
MTSLLIVDDDIAFCEALSRSVQRRGITARHAHSIDSARTICEEFNPLMAVVDLKIDRESGLAVIPFLRERFPEIRILMLTGYSSIATAVDAIKLGADNYLQKPASTSAILAALKEDRPQAQPTHTEAIDTPSLDRLAWEHIQQALKDNGGNISATARQLGMHRRTLQRKLQKRPVKS